MNWSIHSANAHTHLKIVAIALLAAMALVWGSLATHMSTVSRDTPMLHGILSR
ncbi:hypothetical protein [Rhodoplanes sp. Z2-YC6860]|uniref:hypothetical protein n=1 Tax=Rhodoplanes sp. Z2-YC6860 TaxID=674703 RepID=UPI0012EEA241|nr:hypothetical protein [Rhodoplanes sp. Z2-YC6860]